MAESNTNQTTETEENESPETLKDTWMIRECEDYDDEYSECTSIKARFHQYFIFGKYTDCTQWKRDSVNCYKWTKSKDVKAAKEIIESEKARRKERLSGHYNNTVWTKRKEPPDDWSAPLPDYLQKEYENTFLSIKAKELKDGFKDKSVGFMDRSSFCTIL